MCDVEGMYVVRTVGETVRLLQVEVIVCRLLQHRKR